MSELKFGGGQKAVTYERELPALDKHNAVIAEVSFSDNSRYYKPTSGAGEKQLMFVILLEQLITGGDFEGQHMEVRSWFPLYPQNRDGSRWKTSGPESHGNFEDAYFIDCFGVPDKPLRFVDFIEKGFNKKLPVSQGEFGPIFNTSNFDPFALEGKQISVVVSAYKSPRTAPEKKHPVFGVTVKTSENKMEIPGYYVKVADRNQQPASSSSKPNSEDVPGDDDIPF